MTIDGKPRLLADFNGLFGDLLCLSHGEGCPAEDGSTVVLRAGMRATATEENYEDGVRDDLIATGTVEPSPDWLQCSGSRWVLRIDPPGIQWESDLRTP
jgi:hypothetical protein